MKKITGAKIVIETLIQEGVDVIFGYPGGAVLPIYDELFKQKKIRHICKTRASNSSCIRRLCKIHRKSWSCISNFWTRSKYSYRINRRNDGSIP